MSTSLSKNSDNIVNNIIFYQKRKNTDLFKTLEKPEVFFLSNPQNYIPIYNRFFSLSDTNFNTVNLNNKWYLYNIKNKLEDTNNLFHCRIKNMNNDKIKEKTIFIKLAPLLDPFKFLVGKYNISDEKLYKLPSLNSNISDCHSKFLDANNSAYIDGFFVYLTSILKNDFKFNHGLDYFGSFLAIKNNYVLNVFDDLEFLNNSEFFNKNKNILFKIDDYTHLFKNDKQKLKTIKINYSSTAKSELSINSINNEMYDNLFFEKTEIANTNENKQDNFYECNEIDFDIINNKKYINNDANNDNKVTTLKTNSTCSSRFSYTNSDISTDEINENSEMDYGSDYECDSKSNENEDENERKNSEDDEEINVTISKFPVELICMENCETTFDDLILENELTNDEWLSALMQVIMILITYQKVFSFTHNDLHTNNIMYNETSKKYITYCYNKKIYKIPTFGRIFKIIDFGRSIYKFQGKLFCSDSFHAGNDAASQYNIEPYFDNKKPRLEPNFSFDLSRLACSIFDYLIEDLEEIKDVSTIKDPVKKIIVEWCLDDKGINLLYKNNGDERYPDFKLYKMIARHVHNHTPQAQLNRPEFAQFINDTNIINDIDIDIDKIPILC
jgi:hypothetical protein